MLEYDELKVEFEGYEPELKELAGALDLDNLKTEIAKLEEQSAQPDFWNDVENSQKISQKIGEDKNIVQSYEKLRESYDDVMTMLELAQEEDDESMLPEIQELAKHFRTDLESQKLATLLSGEFDHNNAILTFHAGAGGTEAPVATEVPATNNTGDALAEGNSMTFGDVNETVTAKDVSNLRSTPYTGDEGNVVGQLKNGETLVRTGRNDSTGWSRLEYNGQTVYAVSAYLTTDLTYKTPEKPTYPNRVSTQDGRVIVFTDCDDYITPKDLINLRTEPSTCEGESTVRTQVRNGTNLHRTGYSEGSGWSRVEYNGEILYAVTSYVISGSAPE